METIEKLRKNGIFLDFKDIVPLCKKYHISELSIFGSSIREDFNQNSDVDILVSFGNKAEISLFDLMDLETEFSKLLKRDVDIVEKEALKNPIRKNRILSTREIIYAASGQNQYDNLAGALKLSDKQYEYYQKTLQEGRDEWDRNIF